MNQTQTLRSHNNIERQCNLLSSSPQFLTTIFSGRDFAYPSDSEDEGPKRVVRAQKDKMYSELKEQIRAGRNAKNIKDMSKLLAAFETLGKVYEKAKSVISRENLTVPRFFIRYLVELEDFINEQWEDKEARKNMSKANSKSLTTLRQKVRKYNKDFDAEISGYREGPDPPGYSSGAAEEEDEEKVVILFLKLFSLGNGSAKSSSHCWEDKVQGKSA